MTVIRQEKLNKKVTKDFTYSFNISESGLYLIEITARANSWWQNLIKLRSFFEDDDLSLKINGRSSPKLNGKRGLFDGEVAWNGNNLKGLSKTNAFFSRLQAGEQTLLFFSDQKPVLENISIFKIENDQEIFYSPSLNNPPQDGNRRQWLVIILLDLTIRTLYIKANAQQGRALTLFHGDDSDIKLIIDGKVQRNNEAKSHDYWYWCGRTLRGGSKTFFKDIDLDASHLHYIELWADRTPTIEKVVLGLGQLDDMPPKIFGRVALYKDITSASRVNLRNKASRESDIIDELRDAEEVEILEREVTSEWVEGKSYIWHKVRHKGKEGYILSSFVEIVGQEREVVIEKVKQKSQELGIDENLLSALAGCESRFKPYATSKEYKPNDLKIGKGVFQITGKLMIDFNDPSKPFFSKIDDAFQVDENIAAGIKYFKWLYQDRYQSDQDRLRKSIAAYNSGPYSVPIGEKLDLSLYDQQTQQLVACAEENYKKKNWQKIFWPAAKGLLVFGFLLILGQFLAQYDFPENLNKTASIGHARSYQAVSESIFYNQKERKLVFYDNRKNITGEVDYWRLELEKTFQVPREFQGAELVRLTDGAQIYPQIFYFFASTFYACGAQNCTWALYRYDANRDMLEVLDSNIFGVDVQLIPSPDFSKMLVRRDVHGSACDTGSYISILYLKDNLQEDIEGLEDSFYSTVYITSLSWLDEDRIKIVATYHDCGDLSKSLIKSELIYSVSDRSLGI